MTNMLTNTQQSEVDSLLSGILDDDGLSALIGKAEKVGIVGGTVRDIFIGETPKDIDLLVLGLSTEDIIRILKPFGHVDEVGKSFGVIKFTDESGEIIDIAIPRTETPTDGGGHGDFDINASTDISVDEDLIRRDFTFNSMIIWMDGSIHDPFDGIGSIRRQRIEIINEQAFADDPLRIMRAVQFAVRFGFDLSIDLAIMITENLEKLKNLPAERITDELKKFSKGTSDFDRGCSILDVLGISDILFGDTIDIGVVSIKTELELFLHLIATCDLVSSEEILQKFTIGSDNAEFLSMIIQESELGSDIFAAKSKTGTELEMRMIALKLIKFPIQLLSSHHFLHEDFIKVCEDLRTGVLPKSTKHLAVSGGDIMKMGLKGQAIGDMQKELLMLVMKNELMNTENSLTSHIMKAGKALKV